MTPKKPKPDVARRAEDAALERALLDGTLPEEDRRLADAEASVNAVIAEKDAQIAAALLAAVPSVHALPPAQPPFVLCDHAGLPVT